MPWENTISMPTVTHPTSYLTIEDKLISNKKGRLKWKVAWNSSFPVHGKETKLWTHFQSETHKQTQAEAETKLAVWRKTEWHEPQRFKKKGNHMESWFCPSAHALIFLYYQESEPLQTYLAETYILEHGETMSTHSVGVCFLLSLDVFKRINSRRAIL